MDDGEAVDDGRRCLAPVDDESTRRFRVVRLNIDDGLFGTAFRDQDDRLSVKPDVAIAGARIDAGRDQHRVAGLGGEDSGIDRGERRGHAQRPRVR